MKKLLIAVALICILLVAVVYIFIPSTTPVKHVAIIPANANVIYRSLTNPKAIQKWWFDKNAVDTVRGGVKPTFVKDGVSYTFIPSVFNVVEVQINNGKEPLSTYITILTIDKYSSRMEWEGSIDNSNNFFKRIQQYFQTRKIENNIAGIFEKLQDFLNDGENIYGLNIQIEKVKDTLLLATRMITTAYPTKEQYYSLIQTLKDHIARNGALETNYPMLNIMRLGDKMETMVAIPVNKEIPVTGNIEVKRMVMGNIVSAQVKGGINSINEGIQQVENFVYENGLKSPALPFQSLVTNRMQEQDSTKWITKLYYPVF